MIRTAVVTTNAPDSVAAYLPSNYRVVRVEGSNVVIQGEDSLGWTLHDYVIPRLASGLKSCREVL